MKGGTVSAACAVVGISRQTFYRWIGENPGFKETIERARSSFVYRATETVFRDIGNVKTAMWVLKRNEEKEQKWDEIPNVLPYNEMSEESLYSHLAFYEGESQEIKSELARRHPIQLKVTDRVGVTDPVGMQTVLQINAGDEVRVIDGAMLEEKDPDPKYLELVASFT